MKKIFMRSVLVGMLAVPALAGATTTQATSTPAADFTLCQQAAIEKRDTTFGNARTTYNAAMTAALTARKDAEKAAVALPDSASKQAAIKVAVENYKAAARGAQDKLTQARKDAMAAFEIDSKACRTVKHDDRKEIVAEKKADVALLRAEHKTEMEVKRAEVKTLRDTFKQRIESLREWFKKGAVATTTTQ